MDDVGRDVNFRFRRCSDQLICLAFLEAFFEHRDDNVLKDHGFDVLTERLILEAFHKLEKHVTFLFNRVILQEEGKA